MGLFGKILGGIGGFLLSGGNPAGAIAGASLGGAIGSAVGGKKRTQAGLTGPGSITGITTPGFSTSLSDGRLTFESQAGGLVSGAERAATGAISSLTGLDPLIEAGTGRLSTATRDVFGRARERLAGQRRKAIGDVRQNLNRRRLLGSSFADDAINRKIRVFEDAEVDLSTQENQALASNFLQELDLKTQAINQKLNIRLQSISVGLGQLNFESALAAQIASGLNGVLSSNAQFMAFLEAQRSANKGAFLQPFIDEGIQAILPSIGKIGKSITSALGIG